MHQAPGAVRCFGESHEEWAASYEEPVVVRRTSAPCAYFVAYRMTAWRGFIRFRKGRKGVSVVFLERCLMFVPQAVES